MQKPNKYKYDHKRNQHRQWLAERILTVLLSFGYILDPEYSFERVFIKRYSDGKMVKVFTSISTNTSQARTVGADAIRVVTLVKYNHKSNRCLFNKKINRSGTIPSIIERMANAIKEAQGISKWKGCYDKL